MSEIEAQSGGEEPRRLFVALEGGGAKAIVHIGTLRALEERHFLLMGLAGTSAGAIIAALGAAGYRAHEIIDPDKKRTILDTYSEITGKKIRPTQLFGKGGWPMIQKLRYLSDAENQLRIAVWFVTLLLISFFSLLAHFDYKTAFTSIFNVSAAGAILAFTALKIFWLRAGMASARTFRDVLNTLLSHKFFPGEPSRPLTLGDLKTYGAPQLRVIAADISGRRLRLFSSDADADKDLAVADVVCASMCIPFIFRPWKVGGSYYVDGGIVSNLPTWPFDEDRELDVDAITVASQLVDQAPLDPNRGLKGWIGDLAQTALFGSSVLNTRGVSRLEVINLESKLKLLDFDISADEAFRTVSDATNAAKAIIIRNMIDRPKLYDAGCRQLRARVRPILADIPGALAFPSADARVRVSLAFPEPAFSKSLRLVFASGFENDLDEGIILPIDGTLVGDAWTHGVSHIMTPPFDELKSPGLRRLKKTFAKDIRWIFATPIYKSSSANSIPNFVVAIDGSDSINDAKGIIERVIDDLESEAESIFVPLADRLEGP